MRCPVCGKPVDNGNLFFDSVVHDGECFTVALKCERDFTRSKRGRFRNKSEWLRAVERERPMLATKVHCRWIIRRDLEAVMQIERLSFPDPWTEEDFLNCLRERNCIGMVAEHGGTVVAFMTYYLLKHRLAVSNFAVHPDWRRSGVGRQMVDKLASKLSAHRRSVMTVEVCETDLPAQLFLRKMEFRAVKVRRGGYENGDDAYVFEYRVGGEEAEPTFEAVNRISQYEET